MSKKFNTINLLPLIPTVVDAANAIGAEVSVSESPSSPGGKKITPDEALALEATVHEALRPLAKQIVHLATKGS